VPIFDLINKNKCPNTLLLKKLQVIIVNCERRGFLIEVFKFEKTSLCHLHHLKVGVQSILRKNLKKKELYSKLSLTLFKSRGTSRE
jgi:hypothetical protein